MAATTSKISRFEQALVNSMDWLRDVQDELDLDEQDTYQCLRAVFHALRDRLPPAEVAVLGRQLPMVVCGIYYEGWVPGGTSSGSIDDFLADVAGALKSAQGPEIDPRGAVGGVLRVLGRRLPQAELDLVVQAAPAIVREYLAI